MMAEEEGAKNASGRSIDLTRTLGYRDLGDGAAQVMDAAVAAGQQGGGGGFSDAAANDSLRGPLRALGNELGGLMRLLRPWCGKPVGLAMYEPDSRRALGSSGVCLELRELVAQLEALLGTNKAVGINAESRMVALHKALAAAKARVEQVLREGEGGAPSFRVEITVQCCADAEDGVDGFSLVAEVHQLIDEAACRLLLLRPHEFMKTR